MTSAKTNICKHLQICPKFGKYTYTRNAGYVNEVSEVRSVTTVGESHEQGS